MAKRKNSKIWKYIDTTATTSKVGASKIYRRVQNIIKASYKSKSPYVVISLTNQAINKGTAKLNIYNAKSYDKTFAMTQQALLKDYKAKLTKSEIKAVAKRKAVPLENITIQSSQLKTSVKAMMLQNVGRKLTFDQMVFGLQELYPRYASNIYTISNTSLQQMYKQTTWAKTSELFEEFEYAGPADGANRPYCAEHVGQVFTLKEIEDEGIEDELSSFYNCRHSLDPTG